MPPCSRVVSSTLDLAAETATRITRIVILTIPGTVSAIEVATRLID